METEPPILPGPGESQGKIPKQEAQAGLRSPQLAHGSGHFPTLEEIARLEELERKRAVSRETSLRYYHTHKALEHQRRIQWRRTPKGKEFRAQSQRRRSAQEYYAKTHRDQCYPLNARQQELLDSLAPGSSISPADYRTQFHISYTTTYLDTLHLMRIGFLIPLGAPNWTRRYQRTDKSIPPIDLFLLERPCT